MAIQTTVGILIKIKCLDCAFYDNNLPHGALIEDNAQFLLHFMVAIFKYVS